MITFIEGELVEKHPTQAVIQTGGIGYELLIPLSSYDRLPAQGQSVRLLTHYHVREDAHVLFGFSSEQERLMFRRLLTITGIGPKIALSALSGLSPRELKRSVLENDVKRLSSVSGIGKKMAERIVIELRDKIGEGEALEVVAGDAAGGDDIRIRDTVLALVALGYKQADARKMLDKVIANAPPDATAEELVRRCLTG